ncbi:NmrA-like family protein [Xylariaceae sp. FL0804]|nr:NmrA-like family protein [Xylariaceae sp. FL0804]
MTTNYLITQATGQQSQWVIRYLLASGAKVHAVVRDLQKIPPILREPGVTLFQGESKNFDDIFAAAQGCQAAFLNTVPFPGLELLQAKTIVSACEKAGVESLVATTSLLTGDRNLWDTDAVKAIEGLHPYYASKAEVEDVVRRSSFKSYTILRPAVIHFDLWLPGSANNFPRLASEGEFDDILEDGAVLCFTDCHDIGRYAAAALQDPAKFAGQEIDLGHEVLDMRQLADIMTRVSGRKVGVVKRTFAEVQEKGLFVFGQIFQLSANVQDFRVAAARTDEIQSKFGIPFTSLEAALQRDKALLLKGLPEK